MYYLMHCGGMPFNGDTIKTESLGGSETAAYYMAKELAHRGHKVTLFTNHKQGGIFDGVRYLPAGAVSEEFPLGENFAQYSQSTIHDVCIIQRSPYAFTTPIQSKINLLWMHDLAVKQNRSVFEKQMWNVDGVLTVSKYHAEQIESVYGYKSDILKPIKNGIDSDLIANTVQPIGIDMETINLIYSSRPERGLENLVKKGGILDKLNQKAAKKYRLYVCAYDNKVEHMSDYYNYLDKCCHDNPYITQLGALTKAELYSYMKKMDMMVYPTSFKEVSCITAMECMACGLPFISSQQGALGETCKNSGSILIKLDNEGHVNHDLFVNEILKLDAIKLADMGDRQITAATNFEWKYACNMLESHIRQLVAKKRSSVFDVAKELYINSDIYALKQYIDGVDERERYKVAFFKDQLQKYDFAFNNKFEKHYSEFHKNIEHQKEDLSNNPRFIATVNTIMDRQGVERPEDVDGIIVDYGCAHGHYSINMAKLFKNAHIVGIDFMETSLDFAKNWAQRKGVGNVSFCTPKQFHSLAIEKNFLVFDVLIMHEVLEHVAEPWRLIGEQTTYLKNGGLLIASVPYGPWEAIEYNGKFKNYREHIWNIDRESIQEMFGKYSRGNEPNIRAIPYGTTAEGYALGNYIFDVRYEEGKGIHQILLQRKVANVIPKTQSLSVCMLVGPSEETLLKTLNRLVPLADQFVFYIDTANITPGTRRILDTFEFQQPCKYIEGDSPVKIGFDEARNISIREAICSWVLWIDTDEFLVNAQNIPIFLRNNHFNGYSVKQHHYSYEPVATIHIDLPTRLFRNTGNVRFHGVVHEHPEYKLNKGIGNVQLLHHAWIMHEAYETQAIRKKRFARNFPLMQRDREKYPERMIGKFLWIRDTSHRITDCIEEHGIVTKELVAEAKKCMPLFMDVLKKSTRQAVDCLPYYTQLVSAIGKGINISFKVKDVEMKGTFYNEDHYNSFLLAIFRDAKDEVNNDDYNFRFI